MTKSNSSKNQRIEARIAPQPLAAIQRAAELQGRSLSDFIVTSAFEKAQRVIEDTQIIRLSLEDQRAFVQAILDPPPLSPALERAASRYSSLIATQR
jgi:uncharacterized protein (DUF1778 family)